MNRLAVALGLVGMVVGSPAFGADAFVVARTPKVAVNPGLGYVTVKILREVRAGDQVMANETGEGWIIYCGCDEEIRPDRVYTVENRECKVESVQLNRPNLPHIVLPGGKLEPEEELTRCRRGAAAWPLLGAAAVAVGACAAGGCFDKDAKPTSP